MGSLEATEAIKLMTGTRGLVVGRLINYDGKRMTSRKPSCGKITPALRVGKLRDKEKENE